MLDIWSTDNPMVSKDCFHLCHPQHMQLSPRHRPIHSTTASILAIVPWKWHLQIIVVSTATGHLYQEPLLGSLQELYSATMCQISAVLHDTFMLSKPVSSVWFLCYHILLAAWAANLATSGIHSLHPNSEETFTRDFTADGLAPADKFNCLSKAEV